MVASVPLCGAGLSLSFRDVRLFATASQFVIGISRRDPQDNHFLEQIALHVEEKITVSTRGRAPRG